MGFNMKIFNLVKKGANQVGFTLIELMIVVGIIGILVSIAAPNFAKYQAKARQSEAKIALAAIYTGEKSFYSEYSAYASSFDAVGYAPEGARRFYGVGWSAVHSGAIAGFGGTLGTNVYANGSAPYTCGANNYVFSSLSTNLTTDAQTFTVGAIGCIRQGGTTGDMWNITETKILSNNVIGL
jgi:type IV pilus assembly protein PilA